jgi:hypothetical protein
LTPYDPWADPAIALLIAEAEADPDVVGLLLHGSRSVGTVDAESDYDATFLVTDEAMERYVRTGQTPARGLSVDPPIDTTEIGTASLSMLRLENIISWMLPAWADGLVLYDRTGEATRTIDALRLMPEERAREEVAAWYDAYLNAM